MSDSSSEEATATGTGWGENTDREGAWERVQIKVRTLRLYCVHVRTVLRRALSLRIAPRADRCAGVWQLQTCSASGSVRRRAIASARRVLCNASNNNFVGSSAHARV